MSKARLEALRDRFTKKTTSSGGNQNWKLFYQFWKMPDESTAIVRLLPDGDEENPDGFFVKNLTHTLYVNGEKKVVPCLKMYNKTCPCCEASTRFYAEDKAQGIEDSVLGKKYYRKLSYISQVLVIESPIDHDTEQLVKLIDYGPSIHRKIVDGFASGDLDDSPDDMDNGYNFRIRKTKPPGHKWANYDLSSFAPKSTPIDESIRSQITLLNLKDYRTAEISEAQMSAWLEADLYGGEPTGSSSDDSTTTTMVNVDVSSADTVNVSSDVVKTEASASTASSPAARAAAILEKLKAGKNS